MKVMSYEENVKLRENLKTQLDSAHKRADEAHSRYIAEAEPINAEIARLMELLEENVQEFQEIAAVKAAEGAA